MHYGIIGFECFLLSSKFTRCGFIAEIRFLQTHFSERGFTTKGLLLQRFSTHFFTRDVAFSALLQTVKSSLPQRFIDRYCNGVGKIEATESFSHWHTKCPIRIILYQFSRKSHCFLAKDEITFVRKLYRGIEFIGVCGEEKFIIRGVLLAELLIAIVIENIKLIPIVKTCSLQGFIGYFKAGWANDM